MTALDKNDPLLIGLRALLGSPVVVEQLAATATRRFGGFPITKADVQASGETLVKFLTGEAVEFAPAKAGSTASLMKRFVGEGSPDACAAHYDAASKASRNELPTWLLEETRLLVREESARRVAKGDRPIEGDMLYKAQGIGAAMRTKAEAALIDRYRTGTPPQKQHRVNEQTRLQKQELSELRQKARNASDPALREGYTRRADDLEALLAAGLLDVRLT